MYMKYKSTSVITVKIIFSKRSNLKKTYRQKYHPLGFSKYCVNMKISCIPQKSKYINYFQEKLQYFIPDL